MIHPAIVFISGAILLLFLPKYIRIAVILVLPAFALYELWQIPGDIKTRVNLAGFSLKPIFLHPYSEIFGTAFCIAAFAGGLFVLNDKKKTEISAAYIYAGSALGVVLAGDFITLFVFWELMAIASTIVILYGGQGARNAAFRYAVMHIFGGAILLTGIAAYISESHNILITSLTSDSVNINLGEKLHVKALGAWLILIGFLVNVAAPPFSAWLPDAYPEATPAGAVFLSAFTTKTAVFVLLTIFAGTKILIVIGLFMIFYGIIYAMLENDARRILSYSIVNQVGFMVTAIGIGTGMSLAGAAAHAFCHIIYKALLMTSAGVVLYRTGKSKCTELGGLYHSMKFTTICAIIGAVSISAFPLTSGFVSKSLISEAAEEGGLRTIWFLLLAASAGVFLHAGVKFPWFVFLQKDSGLRPKDAPLNMKLAMVFLVSLCILPGLFPEYLYGMLPEKVSYQPYTAWHVVSQLQLLLFSGLAFFVMLSLMKRTETISLDLDWFYRVLLRKILLSVEKSGMVFITLTSNMLTEIRNYFSSRAIEMAGESATISHARLLGKTVLYATIMLCMLLILYYTSK